MADISKMQEHLEKVQDEYDKGLLHPGELAEERKEIHEAYGMPYRFSDEENAHVGDLKASRTAGRLMRDAAQRMYGTLEGGYHGIVGHPDGAAFLQRNYFDRRSNTGSGNKETFFTDQKAPE